MALPKPIEDVPRDRVHAVVKTMLMNPEVADVTCKKQQGGTYKITPKARKP
jgi:hypothetical protein